MECTGDGRKEQIMNEWLIPALFLIGFAMTMAIVRQSPIAILIFGWGWLAAFVWFGMLQHWC